MAEEIMVDLEVADEDAMAIDDVGDQTIRLKSQVTKRKGRGFSDRGGDYQRDFHGDKFDSLEESENLTGTAQRSVEGWIVLITNVHEEASEEDLKEKFGEYGPILNIKLELDRRTGFVKGYCLIEYETFKEAKAAIDSINSPSDETDMYLGRKLAADFAFVRGAGGSRSTQTIGMSKNNRGGNSSRVRGGGRRR